MPFAVYLLAVAVFAMGTSEFMLAGLLSGIAADLDVSVADAGLLTSAFAVGMAVGAPVLAAVSRRWPQRATLFGFVLLFLAAHVLGAVTDSFTVLLTTRIVAAVANAGFLAVALTATARLVGPRRRGRALAVLLGGTTVATVVGVPGGALLGTLWDWRATFWAVALLCLPAAAGVLWGVPATADADEPPLPLRTELARLRRPRLLLVIALGALVAAATASSFTYLALLVTDAAGLGELWVPVALVLYGIGSFAGVNLAGRHADSRPGTVVAIAGPTLLLACLVLGLTAASPVAVLASAPLIGALAFAVGSTMIARVLSVAEAPTMAGSYATTAFNLGMIAGPVLAGATLVTPAAELGPVWTSAALVAAALLLAAATRSTVFGRTATAPAEAAVTGG